MAIAYEEFTDVSQLGIETDSISGEIEAGIPGKTRPVKFVTLYMTAPPYKAVPVKETMIPAVLKKRHKDKDRPELIGKPVFSRTVVHPEETGTLPCFLHSTHERNGELRALGVTAACPGANFPNEFEVVRHMRTKHKTEWALLENLKSEGEKAETKNIQQATLEAMQAQSAALLAFVQGGAPVTPTVAAPAVASERKARSPMTCPDCDFTTPEGHGAPQLVMAKHRKEAHPID